MPRSLRKQFDGRVQPHGLGRTQWRILAYLLRDPGMSQTELARCLELERMTIGLALDKMEKAGLVERRRSTQDRRVQLVYALPKAQALLPQLRQEADASYAELLRGLSDAQIEQFRATLETMARNLRGV